MRAKRYTVDMALKVGGTLTRPGPDRGGPDRPLPRAKADQPLRWLRFASPDLFLPPRTLGALWHGLHRGNYDAVCGFLRRRQTGHSTSHRRT